MGINEKYNIRLEVITPLSIGAGAEKDWILGGDYVIKDGKVYILDIKKMLDNGFDLNQISNLFINGDYNGIIQLLSNKLDNVSKKIYDLPASTINPIKSMVKNQLCDTPIIPGSSLKGAIRSALFSYLRSDEEKKDTEVFGNMNIGENFMRFIKFSDFDFLSTNLVNTKIFNLQSSDSGWRGGWKNANNNTGSTFNPTTFNTLYECIVPGQKSVGSIMFSPRQFDLYERHAKQIMPHAQGKRELIHSGLTSLFHILNNNTRVYLEKEREFFEAYETDKTDFIIESIDYLLNLIPDDDSYAVIKMAAGAGFNAITGDWQFDDYVGGNLNRKQNKDGKPKSRKIAIWQDEFTLMGFVKLTQISEREYETEAVAIHQFLNEIVDKRNSQILQAENEKKAKDEKQKMLLETYNALIQEAEKAWESKDYLKVLEIAEKAGETYPKGTLHQELKLKAEGPAMLMKINMQEEAENAARIEAENKKKAEDLAKNSIPLEERISGITSTGNLAGTIKKWLSVENNTFGDKEFEATVECLKRMNAKGKDIKSKRKDFSKAIGDEYTNKLLELFN